MIISDQYKYLFLATPRTGSTAISKELCKNYDGREILHKHANYHEFLAVASEKQKDYFVFSGVRNPLDDAVSMYEKLRTNHQGAYTNPKDWVENGGWVTRRMRRFYNFVIDDAHGFLDFLKAYYRAPYTSRINTNRKFCDYIIRFEKIQEGFSTVLRGLGLNQKRELPTVNPTKKTRDYTVYYQDEEEIRYAAKIFAPFMQEWGYTFPDKMFYRYTSRIYCTVYETMKKIRIVYSYALALTSKDVINSFLL